MASPDLRDSQFGPRAGNDPAIFASWRRYFEMRLQRRKENFDTPALTDYERRAIEVLVVEVTVRTQSASPLSVEFLLLQSRAVYTTIESQAPDADNVATWEPIGTGNWYIEDITAVEIAPNVCKLQLTVKTWGTWAKVTWAYKI